MNILTGMITQITIKYTYTLIWHLYKQQISSKIQIWMRIAIMIFLNCFGKQYCNTLSWRRKFFFHIYLTEKNLTNQKVRHLFRNWSWLYMYCPLKWILVLHKIRLIFFFNKSVSPYLHIHGGVILSCPNWICLLKFENFQ